MNYKEIVSRCYAGGAAEKVELAHTLASEYAAELLQNNEIALQIELLKTAVQTLDTHMAAMDMGKTCTQCAAEPQGGCCSAYMGNENNDALQLLMNILAGVEVKLLPSDGVECCFLGERGCILLFKPIFCLNYLCWRIVERSGKEELTGLEQYTGRLLGAQVDLEQLIIRLLQQ